MTPSDYRQVFFLGLLLVLTILELELLVKNQHRSRGSLDHACEKMGFVTNSLTIFLLPVLICCPRIAPNAGVSSLVFEIPVLVILSGLWVGFFTLLLIESYVRASFNIGVHILAYLMVLLVLPYTVILVFFSLCCPIHGTAFWTRTSKDLLERKITARKPQHLSGTADVEDGSDYIGLPTIEGS